MGSSFYLLSKKSLLFNFIIGYEVKFYDLYKGKQDELFKAYKLLEEGFKLN